MDKVRIGIIGLGNIGRFHVENLLNNKVENCELVAVCDAVEEVLKKYPNLKTFMDPDEFLDCKDLDAVIIATPHFFHTTLGIKALEKGLHVLVEKPISVHKKDCERLIAAHTNKDQVFSGMFNQRTDPKFKKIKSLIDNGELGDIVRVNWIITDWFRTASYYANGRWRATWKGEGGGVLLNQCPHQLDLLQWLCGMPSKVRGFANLGARHDIEVEDEVTAYLEWPNGSTGVFISSTGEAPGTNRLEITAERGKIVLEDGKLTFTRNEDPMTEFGKKAAGGFDAPETWHIDIPIQEGDDMHVELIQNFTNAIIKGEKLIAPAEEGINSVELANSILFSSLQGKPLDLPMNADEYEAKLNELIAGSNYDQKVVKKVEETNMKKSF